MSMIVVVGLAVPSEVLAIRGHGLRTIIETYEGHTEQGLRFGLTVFPQRPGFVGSFGDEWNETCSDGQLHRHSEIVRLKAAVKLKPGWTFAFGGELEHGGEYFVEGTVRRKVAFGSYSQKGPLSDGVSCEVPKTSWRANLKLRTTVGHLLE